MKMLLALGLVLLQALAIQADLFGKTFPGNDIDALCAGKNVDLTTFSQLKELGQSVRGSACLSTYKDAISELVDLIERSKNDLCSIASINALRAYYTEYVSTSGPAGKDKDQLPESLKKFIIAYGMQVSNACKKNMVHVLSTEGSSLVDESDFEQLEMLIKEDGPVAQFLSVMGSPGEIFLPGDLVPFLKSQNIETNDNTRGEKLVMQTATADYIKKMQSVCQHRFKPIYAPLMMPLLKLVNIGFDYKDEPLRCDLECPKINYEVIRWARIVFSCEALSNARIVEDNKDDDESVEGSSLVRILTEEEANAIERVHPPKGAQESAVTDLVYTPREKVTLDDVIYNKADKQLDKSIKSFATDHDEDYILRQRVSKKGFELIWKQLKSGHFGFILSTAWKSMMRKNKAVDGTTKKFVETLNDMVEQQARSPDGAVAGHGYDRINIEIQLTMLGVFLILAAAMTLGILGAWGVIG